MRPQAVKILKKCLINVKEIVKKFKEFAKDVFTNFFKKLKKLKTFFVFTETDGRTVL